MKSLWKNISWPWLVLVLALSAFVWKWPNDSLTLKMLELLTAAVLSLAFSWLIALAIRKYPTRAGLLLYAQAAGILAGVLLWLSDTYLVQSLSMFYDAPLLAKVNSFRFLLAMVYCSWVACQCALFQDNQDLSGELNQQKSAASLHREAALYKLRQQLQPHFLYNSLNSVNALIAISPEQAQSMVVKLSNFLRAAVRQDGDELIPLREELEYIRNYLDIESIRFGHRLKIEWNISADEDLKLPPLLLQPLLENAIKYGLYGHTGAVTISLGISFQEGLLQIKISNSYDPDFEVRQGTGFGLWGLQQRLQLLFARADLLLIEREETLFTATLKIPQE